MSSLALFSGPDARAALGAGPLQAPTVESPLPGGIAAVVRFLFNLPQWLQVAGFFLGALAALALLVYLWRRRLVIVTWVRTRRRAVQYGLTGAAAAAVLGAAGFGTVSWNYMQHDNGFCTGCHVMGPAYQRFVESEHDSLSCHDCHQQPLTASMRQLYLWVAERPAEIGPHAKVPTAVCASCHVTEQREVWQRIATTAGHRTHLESDSSALRDVQCVTCHGVEVHRFAPVDSTCGQANCHINTGIQLGKMAQQTALHCVNCHQFTAEVPRLATRDSASGTLVPGEQQCLSCHEMRAVLASFDPDRDPHSGTCGMCHNPHTQRRPADARATCTSAGCHADWRSEPFHVGESHRRAAQQCTTCHLPHQAKVDASDCTGCHRAVAERDPRYRRLPVPFDTTRALRRMSVNPGLAPGVRCASGACLSDPGRQPGESRKGKGGGPLWDDPPARSGSSAPADTFPHDRHKSLACITCHTTPQGRGRLTFEPPRGCQICHHQAPATSDCATCHASGELTDPEEVRVAVTVPQHAARSRPVAFLHEPHARTRCVACHTVPVSLALDPPNAACSACHEDHHAAQRDCAACHAGAGEEPRAAHAPPIEGHERCAACHDESTVARLVPDRLMCLTCHERERQRAHYADRECTACHFLTTPERFRAHLVRGKGS